MSRTLYVEFRDDGFWASHVTSAILLTYLIDAARESEEDDQWLSQAISHWEFDATCSDCGLYLNSDWSESQVATVTQLIETALSRLRQHDYVPDPETCEPMPTAPAISLGMGMSKLINRELEAPPPGTWWFFGTGEQPRPINKRKS